MNFSGFTVPDGAFMPPELIYLLPNISGAKLKAIIAMLYHDLQIGGGEPLSLVDIENYTGLSKRQVIRVLTEMLEDGIVERHLVGQSYVYGPSLKTYDKMSYPSDKMSYPSDKMSVGGLRESESKLNININNSLSDSINLTSDKMSLIKRLRSAGVYLKTAQAIVEAHPAGVIEQHLKYYQHALKTNMAQGPGWLVMSLKEGWGAPLGYFEARDIDIFETCPECFTWPCRCE